MKRIKQSNKNKMNHELPIERNASVFQLLERADNIKKDRETILNRGRLPENHIYIYEQACRKEIWLRLDVGGQQLLDVGGICESAKEALPHGRYLPWVRETFPFSERKADYLRAAYLLVQMFPPLKVMKISLLDILSKKDFPRELVKLIATYCNQIHSLKRKDVLAMLDTYKRGNLSPGSEEFQIVFEQQKRFDWKRQWDGDWASMIKILEKKRMDMYKQERLQENNLSSSYKNHYSFYLKKSKVILDDTVNGLEALQATPVDCAGDYSYANKVFTYQLAKEWHQITISRIKVRNKGALEHRMPVPIEDLPKFYKSELCPEDLI